MLDDLSAPRALLLPPPYAAHWLAKGDALTEACRLAPEHGAGTLVWHAGPAVGSTEDSTEGTAEGGTEGTTKGSTMTGQGRFDFAVVLEPDTPLEEARKAFVLGMLALGDAVAAHCPPERAVGFGWPGELLLDAGRLGGMRLRLPEDAREGEVPDWMVLGVELIAHRDHLAAPGLKPDTISLKEEDFIDPPAILESFAAYLMLNFDKQTHGGFAPLAARYAGRLSVAGTLTDAGDLVTAQGDVMPLRDAVDLTPWRDDAGPKL